MIMMTFGIMITAIIAFAIIVTTGMNIAIKNCK